MEDEYNLKDELLAACALLGRQVDSKTYIKGEECLDSLKDLQQFLHRDDPVGDVELWGQNKDSRDRRIDTKRKPWELHRALAEWNIMQAHILPLLAAHAHDDPEVLYESMVVMYLMTTLPPQPKIELDDPKETVKKKQLTYSSALLPSLEGLCQFKEQVAMSKNVLTIIMQWLMEPLLNESERTEPETVILDLALNMIRNLLQVEAPMDSRGERIELPAALQARLAAAQDALLLKFAEEDVLEMLVLLAHSVDEEENRNWNLLLLDIFTIIFAREDPKDVHASAEVMKGAWMQSERRKELLVAAPKPQSVQQRRAKCAIRNSRFTGTFKTSTTLRSYLGVTPNAPPPDTSNRNRKQAFKKRDLVDKPKDTKSAVGRYKVLVDLDKYAQMFVELAFNTLASTVVYDISMESAALEATDDINFTGLTSWVMEFHRLKEKSRIAALPKRTKDAMPGDNASAAVCHAATEPPVRSGEKQEPVSETLEGSAEKLLAMLRDGEVEPGDEVRKQGDDKEVVQNGNHEQENVEAESVTTDGSRRLEARPVTDSDATADNGVTTDADTSAEMQCESGGDTAEMRCVRWATAPSVVTWNIGGRHPMPATMRLSLLPSDLVASAGASGGVGPELEEQATGISDRGEQVGKDGQAEVEATTPQEPPEEPLDPYEFNAGAIASIIDNNNLRWIANKIEHTIKPMLGNGKPAWQKLPPLVALMKEMVNTIEKLYFGRSKTNKDVAETLMRNLVYQWDFGETLLLLIKEFRADRNTRTYFCDVIEVTYTLLKTLKVFADENPNLQILKKKRVRQNRKKVEGKEGEGEWLGGEGSDREEFEEETYEEAPFNFQTYMHKFANFKVVSVYTMMLAKFKQNQRDFGSKTNHQILKMLDLVARKCDSLPLLWQTSIFKRFDKILSDSEAGKTEYKETVSFVKWVVREFFQRALTPPAELPNAESLLPPEGLRRESAALPAHCLFAEAFCWTKVQQDVHLIMLAYKPEEREHKGKKGKRSKDDDEYILAQQQRDEGKWSEDDDLQLKELFEQFEHRANAPQIIASMFDGKSAQSIARRMNKLGLFSSRGGDWSEDEYDEDAEDEEESAANLYVCARRLRNKAPLALDWVIDCYGLACDTRDKTLAAARLPGQELPEEFFEVQDFALVPVSNAEWEHLVNPVTMKLLSAMGCLGPRLLEGHAFWRFSADALRDDIKTASVLDELISAQSAEIEEEPAPAVDSDDDENVSAPASPARRHVAPLTTGHGEEQDVAHQEPSSKSPPTRQKRRIQLQDSDSEDDALDAARHAPVSVEVQHVMQRKKHTLDDSDDETAVGAGKAVEGAVAMVPDVTMPSKRARLAALDSDSD